MRKTPGPALFPRLRRARALHRAAAGAALLGAMTAGLGQAAALACAPGSPAQQYQLGVEAQSAADHAAVLAHWRAAAQGGDVRAQESLGLVLMAGPALPGLSPDDRCEAWRWSRAAADQGSAVGRHQWELLGRLQRSAGLPPCP
ncbi:sel1 repeat family protein [Verticiella sediminum]|uniref:Sel1 repeat family protein n=1 Tax=Verticiella sediminum TaxID=1247510 RepID=A0A556A5X8_9BURK|nr:sel1 repeat family protein [Verticiella sediminum]TSH88277.1 sel1 repeat family protein [Verticiella sediminum]